MHDKEIIFTSEPGEVKLLQATGSDDSIVCAALVDDEFDTVTYPIGRHLKLKDEMVLAGHWGCLDHNYVTFKVSCPIFVARQILRASNASPNEKSGRYLEVEPKFYVPETFFTDVKRKNLNEEPSPIESNREIRSKFEHSCELSYYAYRDMIEAGVRKEQARMVLPLNIFTSFWISFKLSDLLHFLNLRTDLHAQYETRFIAGLMLEWIELKYMNTIHLWKKHIKGPINDVGTIQTP